MGKFRLFVDGVFVAEDRSIDLVAGSNVTLTVTDTEGDHTQPVVEIAAAGGGVTDHGALTGLTDDDHTQYRLESADHTHQTTGLQAGKIDHGAALDGLTDNDHTQYILHSIADAAGDLLLASAADTFARLAIGADGTILTSDGTTASWQVAGAASHPGFVSHSRFETD